MNTQQLVDFLRRHNRWRRGDETLAQESPTDIGNALDAACDTLEDQARMIKRLKVQLTAALDEIVRIRLEIRRDETLPITTRHK